MSSKDTEFIQCETLIDADSFPLWKFDLFILLKAEKLDGIVLGTDCIQETNSEEEKCLWKQKDAKAQKRIVFSIDKKNKVHIMNCETAAEMYKKLAKLYDHEETQVKCNTMEEFFKLQYDPNLNMATNLSRLENIVFLINSNGKKIEDGMHMARIMSMLPSYFQPHFSTAWDSTPDDQKTVTNLQARLIKEENRYAPGSSNDPTPVAFKAQHLSCFSCGGPHLVKFCKSRQNNERFKHNQKKFSPCRMCGRTNHLEKDCRFKKSNFQGRNGDKQKHFGNNGRVSFLTYAQPEEKSFCSTEETFASEKWVIDSGSSSHMTHNADILTERTKTKKIVGTSKKGQFMEAEAVGKIEAAECTLSNVLFLPGLERNLLSVKAIAEKGGTVEFRNQEVTVSKDGEVVLRGSLDNSGLYLVDLNTEDNEISNLASTSNFNFDLHRKLGHLGFENMQKLTKMCTGIQLQKGNFGVCEVCQDSKQARKPFKNQRSRATRPLELVHTDVVEVETLTYDGKKYFVTCLDDFTHFTKIFLMKHKSETSNYLEEYVSEAESKWNMKVHKLRCDNGGEYVSTSFIKWCTDKGIVLDYTIPYTPMLNGSAERLNRSLMEKTRALLFDSGLDNKFWGEALYCATYLLNRCPTKSLPCTPAEKWFNKKPDLSNLKIFGTVVYAKKLGYVKKLARRTKKCILMGYAPNGYRLWDEAKRKIFISRDVVFCENQIGPPCKNAIDDIFSANSSGSPRGQIFGSYDDQLSSEEDETQKEGVHAERREEINVEENECTSRAVTSNYDEEDQITESNEVQMDLDCRIKKLPNKLNDYILHDEDFSCLALIIKRLLEKTKKNG